MNESSMMKYIIGSSRIKFAVLENIFRGTYISPKNVVFHVDANAILYRLYRNKDLDVLYSIPFDVAVKDLVVGFINVLGHYRRFMVTRLYKTNNIIVYFNQKPPIYQTAIYPDYHKTMYEKFDPKHKDYGPINEIVSEAVKFIQSLTPYFEGIYWVDNTGIDNFTAMKHMIELPIYNNWYHIIFSRSMFSTQMISGNCCQLVPKRDDSYIINYSTVFKNGILNGLKTTASENLSPEMLPFIWCLGGCSDIDLKKSKFENGVTGAVKAMNKLVDSGVITSDISIQSFIDAYSEFNKDHRLEIKASAGKLTDRYRVLDLNLSEPALTEHQCINLYKNMVDLYDQESLEALNEKLSMIEGNGELLEITNLNMAECDDGGSFPELFL